MPALSERNLSWDLFWDRLQLDYDAWDTHNRNFDILKTNRLPHFDQTNPPCSKTSRSAACSTRRWWW